MSAGTSCLTADGEKPWREREAEFETRQMTRGEVEQAWGKGWGVLEAQLSTLSDADLHKVVTIRQQPLTVHAALCRSVAHVAYHVGQLVLIGRMCCEKPWGSLSIPRGQSSAYNANPTREKAPR